MGSNPTGALTAIFLGAMKYVLPIYIAKAIDSNPSQGEFKMQKSTLTLVVFMVAFVGFVDSWHAQLVSSLPSLVDGLFSKARYALYGGALC